MTLNLPCESERENKLDELRHVVRALACSVGQWSVIKVMDSVSVLCPSALSSVLGYRINR